VELLLAPDALAVYRPLEGSDDTTYVLSKDLRLVRTNAAWAAFARANGGEQMLDRWRKGASVLEAIPEVLRGFYRDGFLRALATSTPWMHEYECSSPDVYRLYRMIAYPVGGFLIVTNALQVAHPHAPPDAALDVGAYAQRGVVRMCANCRRVHRPGSNERWDWVPALVAHMPDNVSHGLCPPCAVFLYGDYALPRNA